MFAQLTQKIEKALGTVLATENTEEYYEKVVEWEKNYQAVKPGDDLYVEDPTIPSW